MAGLLDLSTYGASVRIQGQDVDVNGVSVEGIAELMRRFPEVQDLMFGEADDISTDALFKLGPSAVVAVIAAGTGAPGDENAEAVARRLSVSDQAALLEEIVRLTFPDGVEDFTNRLGRIASAAGISTEASNEASNEG